MAGEAALLRSAGAVGVPVPTVLAAGEDERVGGAYLVTDFLAGETIPKRVLTEPALAEGRVQLTRQAAEALVGIHRLGGDDLPKLTTLSDPIGVYRLTLDETLDPRPVLELVYRWLDEHRPDIAEPSLVHGDFRMGNLMVDGTGLRAVLDWELAHLGDPMEDVAWPIIRAWRFDRHRSPGDFPDRDRWLAAYEAASGRSLDHDAVRWWEVAGTFKWAVICLSQARRHLDGSVPSLELAAIGRRVVESEHDLLRLLDVPVPRPAAPDEDPPPPGVHGRPTAAELTAALGDVLRGPISTEVSGAARHQLRVAANAVGDRRSRAAAGPGPGTGPRRTARVPERVRRCCPVRRHPQRAAGVDARAVVHTRRRRRRPTGRGQPQLVRGRPLTLGLRRGAGPPPQCRRPSSWASRARSIANARVGDGDQPAGPLAEVDAAQLGHAVLGDDVVHGVLQRGDDRAGRQRGADA